MLCLRVVALVVLAADCETEYRKITAKKGAVVDLFGVESTSPSKQHVGYVERLQSARLAVREGRYEASVAALEAEAAGVATMVAKAGEERSKYATALWRAETAAREARLSRQNASRAVAEVETPVRGAFAAFRSAQVNGTSAEPTWSREARLAAPKLVAAARAATGATLKKNPKLLDLLEMDFTMEILSLELEANETLALRVVVEGAMKKNKALSAELRAEKTVESPPKMLEGALEISIAELLEKEQALLLLTSPSEKEEEERAQLERSLALLRSAWTAAVARLGAPIVRNSSLLLAVEAAHSLSAALPQLNAAARVSIAHAADAHRRATLRLAEVDDAARSLEAAIAKTRAPLRDLLERARMLTEARETFGEGDAPDCLPALGGSCCATRTPNGALDLICPPSQEEAGMEEKDYQSVAF